MEQNDLIFIQNQIGYTFNNFNLLQQAFTRRSYSVENGGENNEVLEFIGDKVLDLFAVKFLITKNSNSVGLYKKFDPNLKNSWLYETESKTFPVENVLISNYSESELTEIKKLLVQKKTLASRIDDLGLSNYLLMGHGDIIQNIGAENSVKEDLFEAILGAIAIDCNWNMEKLQNAVEIMLSPDSILNDDNTEDYILLIQEWSYRKSNGIPLYHFEESGYQITQYSPFDGISQPLGLQDELIHKTKYHCLLKIADDLPIFRAFGQSQTEARKNVCKLAYEFLCKEGYWFSIRDEIDNPNKDNAINQLETLARRGYFSIPIYDFELTYDKDGNPIWNCICSIAEKNKSFSAKLSSKKEAKKSAAFQMLQYVLCDCEGVLMVQ
ncbi:MAG: hypothetical protein IKW08_06340 [Roseburia sp.]|nr:hypothetical protein [Roseburia sp.]